MTAAEIWNDLASAVNNSIEIALRYGKETGDANEMMLDQISKWEACELITSEEAAEVRAYHATVLIV